LLQFARGTKPNKISSNQPTVELRAIAASLLEDLNKEDGNSLPTTSFKSQLAQISLIKQKQLGDYLSVCALRLQSVLPEEESNRTRKAAEEHLCILKAILSI
jgi:hypothetical protein